jgi:hypothetical protein
MIGPSGQQVSVDPGGTPGQTGDMGPNARTGGVVQGQSGAAGQRGGMNVDPGAAGGTGGRRGNGALSGALDDNPERFMTQEHVPASLRAYVRRYFQQLQGNGNSQ